MQLIAKLWHGDLPDAWSETDNVVWVVICAAAPRDQALEFEKRFGVAILDVYGLT